MERESVVSSNLASVGYDDNNNLLEIEFNNGGVYQYSGVPESEYNGLMNAHSHGTYFSANIRDRYPTKRL